MSERTKGILCIISAAFCFALMNLFIKLAGDIPTLQKAFFRNLVAIFFSLYILKKNRISLHLESKNLPLLFGRALFGTLGIFFNFYAIDHLNIADASMLNKLSPFFAILFSYFILKESAKAYQLCCVFTALAGTLFILKPHGDSLLSLPACIGLLGGMAAGLAYTLLRKATQHGVAGPLIVFFFSLFSCLCSLPYCMFHYTPMKPIQLFFLLCTGLAASGGQFAITAAYTHAPASELSVYDYSQIFFAGILGFLFLGETPDILSYIGYMIIIGASIVMFLMRPKNRVQPEQKAPITTAPDRS
ncbi:MAG: DMT family transporter [Lachnospiraceae bacterium]|nr:DMT family transporter [Lachnospiraceae bacterium]